MKLIVYTDDEKTICKVKPDEVLEFSFEGYNFVEVEDNLVEVEQ